MTTIRQIVNDAYREAATTQIAETPDADEFDEGLRRLKTIIKSLYGNEMGEPLTPVSYGSPSTGNSFAKEHDRQPFIDAYVLRSNTRLTVHSPTAASVYLEPQPDDGARIAVMDGSSGFTTNNFTINANGKKIAGGNTLVLSTDDEIREFFFRRDLGEWVEITSLTANSESPFPEEFDDYLSILLAVRLFPRYQQAMSPETSFFLRRTERNFKSRYNQIVEVAPDEALVRMTDKYRNRSYVEERYRFDQGRIE